MFVVSARQRLGAAIPMPVVNRGIALLALACTDSPNAFSC